MKRCSTCKKLKPPSEFSNNGKGIQRKDGRKRFTCRACNTEAVKRWRKNHPDRYADTQRRQNLRRKFGLTVEEYDVLNRQQRGTCAACGGQMQNGNRLAVDHDHKTGRVRGLLCINCNRALGYVDDNPELLRKLAAYLEREYVRPSSDGKFVERETEH